MAYDPSEVKRVLKEKQQVQKKYFDQSCNYLEQLLEIRKSQDLAKDFGGNGKIRPRRKSLNLKILNSI